MTAIEIDTHGKFRPLQRQEWDKDGRAEICVNCHRLAAYYRIEFDDQICLACGDVHPYGHERALFHGMRRLP